MRDLEKNIEQYQKHRKQHPRCELKCGEMIELYRKAMKRADEDKGKALFDAICLTWEAGYMTGYKAGKR